MKHIHLFEEFHNSQLYNDYNESNQKPVALYNADEQKLIAIFKSRELAAKFLFGLDKTPQNGRLAIYNALTRRSRLKASSSRLGCSVAPRNASQEQEKLLGDKDYLILDDRYKEFTNDIRTGDGFLRQSNPAGSRGPRTELRIPDLSPTEIEFANFIDPGDSDGHVKKFQQRQKGRELYR